LATSFQLVRLVSVAALKPKGTFTTLRFRLHYIDGAAFTAVLHCLKMHLFWNGIAKNCKHQFW